MFNNFVKEFKAFVARGSTIDMAVGIVVGSTITSVINTFVKDIIMPPIGVLIGGVDFSNFFVVLKGKDAYYPTLAAAQASGATTLNLGIFINSLVSFAITMFGIFLFVRAANKVREKHAGARTCPYCKMTNVASDAVKCPYCCSALIPKRSRNSAGIEKVVLNTVKVTAKTLGKTTKTIGKTTKMLNKEISKNLNKIKDVIN